MRTQRHRTYYITNYPNLLYFWPEERIEDQKTDLE
jgi:hypothetical protein